MGHRYVSLSRVCLRVRDLMCVDNLPSVLQGYCPFITVDKFVQKCREVYFAVDDYSDATFIVVNACLYNVFIEWTFTSNEPAEREEYKKHINLCRNNLETALANMSLLMPARDEYIEALTLGVCLVSRAALRKYHANE